MIYTENEARELILKACEKLQEEKLIARTWGNVSARISKDEFIITPSGLAYETLKPEDLVKVKINDLSYEGSIKPSSEKGVHALCYKNREDIGFVIHTHQDYASAVSVLGKDTDFAPCAKYGLPGTKKLRKEFEKSLLSNPEFKAFLLQRHGAVCLGTDFDDAFDTSKKLELDAKQLYEKNKVKVTEEQKSKPFLDDYAQIMGPKLNPVAGEDAQAVCMIAFKNSLAASYTKEARQMQYFDVLLQNFIYRKKYSKLKDSKK